MEVFISKDLHGIAARLLWYGVTARLPLRVLYQMVLTCQGKLRPSGPSALSAEFSDHKIQCQQSSQQNPTLQRHRGPMPTAELRQQGTICRRGLNGPHLHPQRRHPGAHRMLRHNGQPNHDQNAEARRRDQPRKRPRPGKPRHQDRNPANHPDHVHPPKPMPHHGPSLIAAGQDPKGPRRHHKAEKHITPQPQTKSKKLDRAQNGRHKWIESALKRGSSSLQQSEIWDSRCSCALRSQIRAPSISPASDRMSIRKSSAVRSLGAPG